MIELHAELCTCNIGTYSIEARMTEPSPAMCMHIWKCSPKQVQLMQQLERLFLFVFFSCIPLSSYGIFIYITCSG